VVHFLTRQAGVVHLIAKGIKRPKSAGGGAIDLLAEGELVFSMKTSGSLGILIEFSQTLSRAGLRRDTGRLNSALYMIELVGEFLAPEDPHSAVFDLLHNALVRLGHADAPTQAVLAYFQWRLLRNVGLLGGLGHCVSCSMPITEIPVKSTVYFSSELGGILCEGCQGASREKFLLEPSARSGLATLAAAEAGQKVLLPKSQATRANKLMAYHIAQQLGKALRMTRHVINIDEPRI
jgi:DNA repair protein RecO